MNRHELVANCVRHVRFPLRELTNVRISRSADTIRVEAKDPGEGVPAGPRHRPDRDAPSGRF